MRCLISQIGRVITAAGLTVISKTHNLFDYELNGISLWNINYRFATTDCHACTMDIDKYSSERVTGL